MQQCNKYKSELIHFRKQAGLSTDDIPLDEGYFYSYSTGNKAY
jgi:hypothetical protein